MVENHRFLWEEFSYWAIAARVQHNRRGIRVWKQWMNEDKINRKYENGLQTITSMNSEIYSKILKYIKQSYNYSRNALISKSLMMFCYTELRTLRFKLSRCKEKFQNETHLIFVYITNSVNSRIKKSLLFLLRICIISE